MWLQLLKTGKAEYWKNQQKQIAENKDKGIFLTISCEFLLFFLTFSLLQWKKKRGFTKNQGYGALLVGVERVILLVMMSLVQL